MHDGLIEANSAGLAGGGIYTETGTANLTNVSIQRNSAHKGGGFYLFSGTLNLDGCTISNNTALTLGSGGARKPGATYNPFANCTITDVIALD